ncbi:hypothetical protein INT48_000916 [Thamnidium elegans]|uniref:Uncharacterized protein n=1 Tax=Thamnidium elegans TaxID=101142 RepID=A0A8H7SGD4_9FUNG|nr:hypothetical protein INT48_000916 [Thamnidium elegans]
MDVDDVEDMVYLQLPPTLVITSKYMNQGTGLKTYSRSLIRKKKTTLIGHQELDGEEELSRHSLYHCDTPEELEQSYTRYANARDTQRKFYYNRSNCNRKRRIKLSKRQYCDKTAKKPIMFIGDRDHGIGSFIKGHRRFGGFKKQNKHGQNTSTLITNEYNSSQTWLFCFNKLSRPVSAAADKVSIAKASVLAIGLVALAYLLFGLTFSCFGETSTVTSKAQFSEQEITNGLAYRWRQYSLR